MAKVDFWQNQWFKIYSMIIVMLVCIIFILRILTLVVYFSKGIFYDMFGGVITAWG